MAKKKCPACGHDEFTVTAHVTQTWRVDANGNFMNEISGCDDVTHKPDDQDLWTCAKCGYNAAGAAFNVQED